VAALTSEACVLEELDVGGCNVADVPSILDAAQLRYIHSIDFSGTALVKAGAFETLSASPLFARLRSLGLGNVGLCASGHGGGTASQVGLRILCTALQRPHALQHLGLQDNHLRDEDAQTIAHAAPQVATIDLSGNRIFDSDHEAFPKAWTLLPPDLAGATVPLDESLDSQVKPNVAIGPSSTTHDIITVTEGLLCVSVAFGSGGDSDQHFGVLDYATADKASDYSRLRRSGGWCIKDSSRPCANGQTCVHLDGWPRLRGKTVSMLLDVPNRSVSFWLEDQTVTLHDLPEGKPLTAAFGTYNNTASVVGLRHILPRAL